MPCLMVLAALVWIGPAQISCTGDHPPLNLTLRGEGTADQASHITQLIPIYC